VLSPWPRCRCSGPPPWPRHWYAHAFALALCNHARTHVPVPRRATMGALAFRGQGRAYGFLLRLTSSALRPAPGRGFTAEGNPSTPEARAPTRSRSCAPALAHARANPIVVLHTSSKTCTQFATAPSLYFTSLPRTSFRLGARASGQVSARVRPHARTQANTPACHRGARRRGQATDMPARSSEDMDAAFGRPMLPHTREGHGLAFLWPDLM
jgi:hypothetical protein